MEVNHGCIGVENWRTKEMNCSPPSITAQFIDFISGSFVLFGHHIGNVEMIGFVFFILSVVLLRIKSVLTWPTNIISALSFLLLFYQMHLYSDLFEQAVYVGLSGYTWWNWQSATVFNQQQASTSYNKHCKYWFIRLFRVVAVFFFTVVISLMLGYLMKNIHELLPQFSIAPADFPYIDAFTSVANLTAIWLIKHQKRDYWIYLISATITNTWVYFTKEIWLLYILCIFLIILTLVRIFSRSGLIRISRDN